MAEKRTVGVRLAPDVAEWLEGYAARRGVTKSVVLESAVSLLREADGSGLEEAPASPVVASPPAAVGSAKSSASPRAPAEKPVDSRPRDRMGRLTPSSFKSREAYLGYLRRGER